MPHVRNVNTGVTASVNDETLDRLGSDWEPVVTKNERVSRTRKDPES